MMEVIGDYTAALELLGAYDRQTVAKPPAPERTAVGISYEESRAAIDALRRTYNESALFGNEKDESLKSSLRRYHQTFNGKDLYASIEEKAANLLYFIVKNHSFTDGNKRIAASLFLWFLERNGALYSMAARKR